MEHIIKLDTFGPNLSLIFQTNGLTLFHINIRSIRKDFSALKFYLAPSSTVFDLICVSETFLHIDEPFCLDVPDYSFIFISWQERGGGVGIYVRDGIGCRGWGPVAVAGAEVLSAVLDFLILSRQIRLVVVYRKPSSTIQNFLHDFGTL